MDPDDMYLNENLFNDLYYYNLKINLDIIEFSVFDKQMVKIKYIHQIMTLKHIIINLKRE